MLVVYRWFFSLYLHEACTYFFPFTNLLRSGPHVVVSKLFRPVIC